MAKPWKRAKKNLKRTTSRLPTKNLFSKSGGNFVTKGLGRLGQNASNFASQFDPFNDDGAVNEGINNPSTIIPNIVEGGQDFAGTILTEPLADLDPFNDEGKLNEMFNSLGQNVKDSLGIQSIDDLKSALGGFIGGGGAGGPAGPYLQQGLEYGSNLLNQDAPFPGLSDYTTEWQGAARNQAQNQPFLNQFQSGINSLMNYQNPAMDRLQSFNYDNPANAGFMGLFNQNNPANADNLLGRSNFENVSNEVDQFTGTNPALNQYPGIINQAGANPYTSGLVNTGTGPNVGTQYLSGMRGGVADTSTPDYLRGTAAGDMLNGNPYIDRVIDRASQLSNKNFDRTLGSINKHISGVGRFSPELQRQLFTDAAEVNSESQNAMIDRILAGNYDAERGRQLQATGMLGDITAQNLNRDINLGSSLASSTGSDLNRGVGAYGTAGSLYSTGIGNQLSGLGQMGSIYGQDMNRGLTGTGIKQGAYQDAFGNDLSATGLQSDIYNSNITNRLNALNPVSQNYNTGTGFNLQNTNMLGSFGDSGQVINQNTVGMIPQLQGLSNNNLGLLRDVGGVTDANNIAQYNAPWDKFGRFMSGAAAANGPAQPTGLQQALGTGLDMAMIYNLLSGG